MSNYQLDYKGKKCVVTGAASGMGKSVVEMLLKHDAEIYGLDMKDIELPIKKSVNVNLADRSAIDKAIDQLPDDIDCVFHVAGLPGQTYGGKSFSDMDVITVNYIGARYFLEKMFPKTKDGGSIIAVSSIAGFNWRNVFNKFKEFIDIPDWDGQMEYLKGKEGLEDWFTMPTKFNRAYMFSKECLCIYCTIASWNLAARKVRFNTILPGATKTPMHKDFNKIVGREEDGSMPVSPVGEESTPEQQASAMLLFNSDMADYVSGQAIMVDFCMGNLMTYGVGKS